MTLVKRYTPGGNMYPDGSSTFAVLAQFFREQAENLDLVNQSVLSKAAADATTKADAARDAAISAAASDATTKADAARDQAVSAAASTADAYADAALAEANTYTDTQVAAVQAGEVPDSRIDSGVDRAITDGRIDTTLTGESIANYYQHDINLGHLGAVGDGSDSSTLFDIAIKEAHAGHRSYPFNITTDKAGTKTIEIPAGDYTISQIRGLMGVEPQGVKIAGLRIRGAGSSLTNIFFNPATDGALVFNDYWQNIAFEGIGFRSMRPGATFMQSYTTHAAQKYRFTDISWTGSWKYVFDLQGTNNNCEFSFYSCQSLGLQNDGAFMYIGALNTSDQFLNYWFYAFKFWSTGAPLIDAARGGHFHFFGLDVSDWAPNATSFSPIFKLRGKTHSHGTCTLTARGMRVEAKSVDAALLYSEWGDGNVDIQVDWSSHVWAHQYNDVVHIKLDNVSGPIYNLHDSNLAGGIKIEYSSDQWKYASKIFVQESIWQQRLTPSEVVSYVRPGTNPVDPSVEFVQCRGMGSDPYSTTGASVWEATVGYNQGPIIQPARKRQVTVRGTGGNPTSAGNPLKINLPVGALVTGLRVLAPAGAVGETDGGSWTVSTTEATPRTIAAATVTGSRANGYNTGTELPIPFLCSTRESATVNVTATDISQSSARAMILIEGYW